MIPTVVILMQVATTQLALTHANASQDLVAVSMTDLLIVNQCNVYTVIIWNRMIFSSTNHRFITKIRV